MKQKQKQYAGYFNVRRMIVTLVLVLFFICGILYYYFMLYNETRRHIIKLSELNAEAGSNQVEDYLFSGVGALKLAGYTLDNMIRSGSSKEEIVEYLQNQSVALSNITAGASRGLYGYINSCYMDGTDLLLEKEQDLTKRPWYVDAQAAIGHVSIVGPYQDVKTGQTVITLSKTLCDVKSVIAMDFSMDVLQERIEDFTSKNDSSAVIVLNREYQVVAHSEKLEVGKNYFTEQNTFGRALVDELRTSHEKTFSVKYRGSDYIVYAATVADEWFCLSVIDASAQMNRLNRPLLFMIAAAIALLIVQLLLLHRTRKNARITEKLSEDLDQTENVLSEKITQLGEISQIAFRDTLTGVGSKTAYIRRIEAIAEQRKTEQIPTAVVMMDVNNLKIINDTYGHDCGDKYLRSCCRLICQTFRHSPVFRIGGDEFVAILQNGDYEIRTALIRQIRGVCEATLADKSKQPWERCSIAVGMAECEPEETTLEQTLLRADKAMYEAKRYFKERNGIPVQSGGSESPEP